MKKLSAVADVLAIVPLVRASFLFLILINVVSSNSFASANRCLDALSPSKVNSNFDGDRPFSEPLKLFRMLKQKLYAQDPSGENDQFKLGAEFLAGPRRMLAEIEKMQSRLNGKTVNSGLIDVEQVKSEIEALINHDVPYLDYVLLGYKFEIVVEVLKYNRPAPSVRMGDLEDLRETAKSFFKRKFFIVPTFESFPDPRSINKTRGVPVYLANIILEDTAEFTPTLMYFHDAHNHPFREIISDERIFNIADEALLLKRVEMLDTVLHKMILSVDAQEDANVLHAMIFVWLHEETTINLKHLLDPTVQTLKMTFGQQDSLGVEVHFFNTLMKNNAFVPGEDVFEVTIPRLVANYEKMFNHWRTNFIRENIDLIRAIP